MDLGSLLAGVEAWAATRRQLRVALRNALTAAILALLAMPLVLIALGFASYAGYTALLDGHSPAAAALLVAGAALVIALAPIVTIWLLLFRRKVRHAMHDTADPLAQLTARNKGLLLAAAAIAGLVAGWLQRQTTRPGGG